MKAGSFPAVLSTIFVILAFVLRAAIPSTLFLGVGGRFRHVDRLALWAFLIAGLILAMIAILKIVRGEARS